MLLNKITPRLLRWNLKILVQKWLNCKEFHKGQSLNEIFILFFRKAFIFLIFSFSDCFCFFCASRFSIFSFSSFLLQLHSFHLKLLQQLAQSPFCLLSLLHYSFWLFLWIRQHNFHPAYEEGSCSAVLVIQFRIHFFGVQW